MDPRTALTPGSIKRNMRCECETLVMLANSHIELRQFLGRPAIRDRALQSRRTVVDNVDKLSPELLDAIDVEIVERGRKLQGKTPETPARFAATLSSWRAPFAGRRMPAFRGRGAREGRPGGERVEEGGLARMAQRRNGHGARQGRVRSRAEGRERERGRREAQLEICKPFVAWMEKTAGALASGGPDRKPIKIKPNKIRLLEHSSVAIASCSTRSGGASSRAKRFRITRSSSRSSSNARAGYRRARRAASPNSDFRPPLSRTGTDSSWRRS